MTIITEKDFYNKKEKMEQNNILKDNGGQYDIHTKTDENCDHVLKNWDKIIQANIHNYETAEVLTLKNSKNWRREKWIWKFGIWAHRM